MRIFQRDADTYRRTDVQTTQVNATRYVHCVPKGSPTLSTSDQTTVQVPTSPNVCFCTTWGKRNTRNRLWHRQRTSKNIPDVIDCNLKKDDKILIVFGTNIKYKDVTCCSDTWPDWTPPLQRTRSWSKLLLSSPDTSPTLSGGELLDVLVTLGSCRLAMDHHWVSDGSGRRHKITVIMESRRNGPQLSSRHDDDACGLPECFAHAKTFEVHSMWRNIERHYKYILSGLWLYSKYSYGITITSESFWSHSRENRHGKPLQMLSECPYSLHQLIEHGRLHHEVVEEGLQVFYSELLD